MQQDFERQVIRELMSEYESICNQRRLNLRPVVIAMDHSQSHWASYNPLLQTIFISKKLVYEHPWLNVLGILRHEMAHQWVYEYGLNKENLKDHGAAFHKACEIVGVPDPYCRAGVDLQTETIDWRQQGSDSEAERMLEKVRKLLALAGSSNEHEAVLAMNRVREIYAKYNLQEKAQSEKKRFVHAVICHEKKRAEAHHQKIASILLQHFFVHVISFRQYSAKNDEFYHAFELIGTRENVLMAEYVYHFLLQQVETLVNKIELPKRAGRRMRTSYRLGILVGFSEKLRRSSQTVESSPLIDKALVAFHNDQELNDYYKNIYPSLITTRQRGRQVDRSAFYAGQQMGQQLNLNKPVTERSGPSGRLLTS